MATLCCIETTLASSVFVACLIYIYIYIIYIYIYIYIYILFCFVFALEMTLFFSYHLKAIGVTI